MLPSVDDIKIGDVPVEDVICNNIKPNNESSVSLTFTEETGLTGMLLQHVKQYWMNHPSVLGKQTVRHPQVDVLIAADNLAFSPKGRLFHVSTSEDPCGLVEVRRGMHTIKDIIKYQPILSAVVDVTFRNVTIRPSRLYLNDVNIVSYESVDVDIISEMNVCDYELK